MRALRFRRLAFAKPEILYAAPARFRDGLPIATLQVAEQGRPARPMSFLIDSGANRSFLFPRRAMSDRSAGLVRLGVESSRKPGFLGKCELASVPSHKPSPQALEMMEQLGVDGDLGLDFLSTHDVLIDYSRSKIYFSQGYAETEAGDPGDVPNRLDLRPHLTPANRTRRSRELDLTRLNTHRISLTEENEFFYVSASIRTQEETLCVMVLDTGTGESELPKDLASHLPPTGAKRTLVGFQGKASTVNEVKAKISFADSYESAIRFLGSDQSEPILGGNAFAGKSLLLQLRFSQATFW